MNQLPRMIPIETEWRGDLIADGFQDKPMIDNEHMKEDYFSLCNYEKPI